MRKLSLISSRLALSIHFAEQHSNSRAQNNFYTSLYRCSIDNENNCLVADNHGFICFAFLATLASKSKPKKSINIIHSCKTVYFMLSRFMVQPKPDQLDRFPHACINPHKHISKFKWGSHSFYHVFIV